MFYFGLVPPVEPAFSEPRRDSFHYTAEYIIGDHRYQYCLAVVNQPQHWRLADYQRQWREGIERLATHDTSCLVLTFSRTKKFRFASVMCLYRNGEEILIEIYPYTGLDHSKQQLDPHNPFTPDTCYDFIPLHPLRRSPRHTASNLSTTYSELLENLKDRESSEEQALRDKVPHARGDLRRDQLEAEKIALKKQQAAAALQG
jgi:hypothetical protein